MTSDLSEPDMADYYADLGIAQDTSTREVRAAFLRLAKVHHPDKQASAEPADAGAFRKVHEAYDCLNDEKRRSAYDRLYASGLGDRWARYRQCRAATRLRHMEARLQAEQERRDRDSDEAWEEEQRDRKRQYEKQRQETERTRTGPARLQDKEAPAARKQASALFMELRAAEEQRFPLSPDRTAQLHALASSRDSQTCVHPQRRWPAKRRSGGSCVFCGKHCDGWTLQCPQCHSPACRICKAHYALFLYDA